LLLVGASVVLLAFAYLCRAAVDWCASLIAQRRAEVIDLDARRPAACTWTVRTSEPETDTLSKPRRLSLSQRNPYLNEHGMPIPYTARERRRLAALDREPDGNERPNELATTPRAASPDFAAGMMWGEIRKQRRTKYRKP